MGLRKLKTLTKMHKGENNMGTIICQQCNKTISVFEGEKVTTLYAKGNCEHCKNNKEK